MDIVIEAENLCKIYPLYAKPSDRLKEIFHPLRRRLHREFHALRDVNIRIARGESVGLIGLNGSGKSTLLQIIAGVVYPSSGRCVTKGRISALLELGAGFNPELSGRENARFQCCLLGVPAADLDRVLAEVLDFAEIGAYAEQPIKTYSSGMTVRLAFAIGVATQPDIFIVDEALAVGDIHFQTKCLAKIRELRTQGVTLLFVSHDAAAVKTLCDRTYLLHKGQVLLEGVPEQVFNAYNNLLAIPLHEGQEVRAEVIQGRYGTGKLRIESVRLKTEGGYASSLPSGLEAEFEIQLRAHEAIADPTVGISIRNSMGIEVFGINNFHLGVRFGKTRENERYLVVYRVDLRLGPGRYTMAVAAHAADTHVDECFDWLNDAFTFEIQSADKPTFAGFCALETRAMFETLSELQR